MQASRRAFAFAAALLGVCAGARGQTLSDYPSRPVSVVVPFAAGGASDVLMRVVTQRLTQRLGGSFVIDNRAGANGKVGMTYIARAAPDGYTLGVGATATMANNPVLYRELPYDAARDFAAVAMVGMNTTALVVNKDLPVRSVAELVAMMKAKQRYFSFGSAGVGNTAHLAGEMFKRLAGVEMEHVPYRGGNEIMRDLMGGQIQLSFSPLLESMPYVASGALRALAVTRPQRTPHLPDVPTMAEAGVPGISYSTWQGLVAPAGTPRDIVLLLNQTVRDILREPETLATLKKIVIEPQPMSPDEFADFMTEERKRWGEAAKQAGVHLD